MYESRIKQALFCLLILLFVSVSISRAEPPDEAADTLDLGRRVVQRLAVVHLEHVHVELLLEHEVQLAQMKAVVGQHLLVGGGRRILTAAVTSKYLRFRLMGRTVSPIVLPSMAICVSSIT